MRHGKHRSPRCTHDLTEKALTSAIAPIEVTNLFWKAGFSGAVWKRLKTKLLNTGLLEVDANGLLHTTEKGEKWLRAYKALKKLTETEKHEQVERA